MPDLITVMETESGQPITTEELRYGQRVRVIAAPCDRRWRTPAGLALVGPRYFGYDLDYVPVEGWLSAEGGERERGSPDRQDSARHRGVAQPRSGDLLGAGATRRDGGGRLSRVRKRRASPRRRVAYDGPEPITSRWQATYRPADGARTLAESVREQFGRVDILINNAGPFAMDPFVDLPEAEWDRIWNTNVKAAYVSTKVLAPGMREAGWGRIVNISAGSAYMRNHSIYTLAKSALITLTEELAVELGPEITVNAVAPGQIAESADDMAAFDATFVERAVSASPLRRLVTRPEVATIVGELCGPRYAGVTGVTIPVDAGSRIPRF